jgi:hypothetical protein
MGKVYGKRPYESNVLGSDVNCEREAVVGTALYAWIPAFAGMTRDGAAECCRVFEGVPQILSFRHPPRLGARGLIRLR